MKTPHYPIYLSQVADHQTLLMDPSFLHSNLLYRLQTAMLDFTRHVHETRLALTLQCRPILKTYHFCALLSLLVILLYVQDTTSVPEWER